MGKTAGKVLLALVLAAGGTLSNQAHAGAGCVSGSTCYFDAMPLLDQTNPDIGSHWLPNGPGSSMLCGPTAGAMAVAGVIAESKDNPTGWTASQFKGKSGLDQIRNMSALMSTDPVKGTIFIPWSTIYGAGKGTAGRKSDFRNAGGGVSFFGPTVSNSTFTARLHAAQKRADIINYGHYTKKSKTILGVKTTWYSRGGGHFVTVNGHQGEQLRIYDPWGGVRKWNSIFQIHGGVGGSFFHPEVTVLPTVGFTSSVLYSSGDQYKIIDGEMGLWAD